MGCVQSVSQASVFFLLWALSHLSVLPPSLTCSPWTPFPTPSKPVLNLPSILTTIQLTDNRLGDSWRKGESEALLVIIVSMYSVGASYLLFVSQQPECHSSQCDHMKHMSLPPNPQAFSAFTVMLLLLGIPFPTTQPFFAQ